MQAPLHIFEPRITRITQIGEEIREFEDVYLIKISVYSVVLLTLFGVLTIQGFDVFEDQIIDRNKEKCDHRGE